MLGVELRAHAAVDRPCAESRAAMALTVRCHPLTILMIGIATFNFLPVECGTRLSEWHTRERENEMILIGMLDSPYDSENRDLNENA